MVIDADAINTLTDKTTSLEERVTSTDATVVVNTLNIDKLITTTTTLVSDNYSLLAADASLNNLISDVKVIADTEILALDQRTNNLEGDVEDAQLAIGTLTVTSETLDTKIAVVSDKVDNITTLALTNVPAPEQDLDAANKQYIDQQINVLKDLFASSKITTDNTIASLESRINILEAQAIENAMIMQDMQSVIGNQAEIISNAVSVEIVENVLPTIELTTIEAEAATDIKISETKVRFREILKETVPNMTEEERSAWGEPEDLIIYNTSYGVFEKYYDGQWNYLPVFDEEFYNQDSFL